MVKESRSQRIASYVADWPKEKVTAFQQDFLAWYDKEKRHLPWRESQDPYRIWVSEIMLQQTQVATVIPYFERFMAWFPTIADLAAAPEDQLLKAWEGLGYYSRVRNMQFAAQTIMEEYDGEMPSDLKSLLALKGLGRIQPERLPVLHLISRNQLLTEMSCGFLVVCLVSRKILPSRRHDSSLKGS